MLPLATSNTTRGRGWLWLWLLAQRLGLLGKGSAEAVQGNEVNLMLMRQNW